MVEAAGITGAVVALGAWGYVGARHKVFGDVAHINTGEQRRSVFPLDRIANNSPGLSVDGCNCERKLLSLQDGFQFFYNIVTPKKGKAKAIVLYAHGYSDQCDLSLEVGQRLAEQGFVVVLFDCPGHGRSDGDFLQITDWFEFIDRIWQFVDLALPLARTAAGPAAKKIFAMGESMGGGILTTMALQKPEFFAGIILVAPMLVVSDKIRPPHFVTMVFKHVLRHILGSWFIVPIKDMDEFLFRIPEQGFEWGPGRNPICSEKGGKQPRVCSGYAMGFQYPEWLEGRIQDLRTPFLLLHGADDRITDPEMSKKMFAAAAATDKELKLIPQANHCELVHLPFSDIKPEQKATVDKCYADIAAWIAKRS